MTNYNVRENEELMAAIKEAMRDTLNSGYTRTVILNDDESVEFAVWNVTVMPKGAIAMTEYKPWWQEPSDGETEDEMFEALWREHLADSEFEKFERKANQNLREWAEEESLYRALDSMTE